MAGRDDGEFELILGNKQLLSVLFIVIVLLGVFFAMGFLAGRSTGSGAADVARRNADQVPITVDAATSKSSEAAPAPAVERAPVEIPAQPESQPAAEPRAEAARPAAAEPKAPPAKPAETPKPAGAVVENPPSGTYLQVAAVGRADAENMLNFIAEKIHLRGYVTPVPKSSEQFRVLVGPLKTNEDMAAARTKLADIGLKTPYPVKY